MERYVVEPYGFEVFHTTDWEDFQQAREDRGIERYSEKSLGVTSTVVVDGKPHCMVYWNKRPEILVHECAHVIFNIFDYVGILNAAECDNEPFCYALDNLFAHIWSQYNGEAKNQTIQAGDLPANGIGHSYSENPESGPAVNQAVGFGR